MRKIKFISIIVALILPFLSGGCSSKQTKDNLTVDSISEVPVDTQVDTTSAKGEPSTLQAEHSNSYGESNVNAMNNGKRGNKVMSSIPRNGKPTVVDFSATWCGPCRAMKPIFESLADELGDKFNFVTIDVDENPELANKYQIQSIPAFVFLDEDGIEGDRKVGSCSQGELKDLIVNGIWH